jgi:hypothetical protein
MKKIILCSIFLLGGIVNSIAEEVTVRPEERVRSAKNSSFKYQSRIGFVVDLDIKAETQSMDDSEYQERKRNLPKTGAVFALLKLTSSNYSPEDLIVVIKKNGKVIDKRTGNNFDVPAKLVYENGKYNMWGVFSPKVELEPPYDVHIINGINNRFDIFKVRK